MTGETNKNEVSLHPSAVKYISGELAEAIKAIDSSLLELDESELEELFHPTPTDYFLRKRFWKLIRECESGKLDKIETVMIYRDICSRQGFYKYVKDNPRKLCWILKPIDKVEVLIEEAFFATLTKVRREVLSMPVNEKTVGSILKALEFFANRHLGPMVQKVEQKNLNIDANKMLDQGLDAEQLQTRYEELKSKMLNPNIKDVTPKDGDSN